MEKEGNTKHDQRNNIREYLRAKSKYIHTLFKQNTQKFKKKILKDSREREKKKTGNQQMG